jgi:hypothetical protein
MTISPADGQSTYLWGDGAGRGKLFVLEKSGSAWSLSRSPIIGLVNGNTYSIQSVTASPDQPGECWAGLAGNLQILHTTDNWRTWYPLSPVPGKVAFQSSIISLSRIVGITVTPHFTSQMFVATDNTVFWTYNGGTSWLVFQDGLPAWAPCNVIRYLNNGDGAGHDALVLSTYGRGMYAANQLGVVFVDQGNATGVEDGTITHPYSSIPNGVNGTPNGGVMAINGLTKYSVPSPYNNFTKPMTITSYGAQTTITH